MDPAVKYYFVMPLSLIWALVSIHAGRQNWKCLVTPPPCLESVRSHVFLKALFGRDVIKNVAVATGWIALGIAFYVMYCL